MVDIARPDSVIRKKKMKRAAYGVAGLTVILLVTVFVSRLKPAAPSVDKATLWPDVVKRGPMVRQVRGTGTLVPEDTRWIPATTAGRVETILLRSGADVSPTPSSSSWAAPSSNSRRRRSPPAGSNRPRRSSPIAAPSWTATLLTQRAAAANDGIRGAAGGAAGPGRRGAARRRACRAPSSPRRTGPRPTTWRSAPRSSSKRLELAERTLKSQLAVQESEVSRLRTTYELRRQQLEKLKVRAGIKGKLQVVPVEVGSQLAAGANVARVADPRPPEGRTAHPRNPDPGHRDRADRLDRHTERLRRPDASHASTRRPPTER